MIEARAMAAISAGGFEADEARHRQAGLSALVMIEAAGASTALALTENASIAASAAAANPRFIIPTVLTSFLAREGRKMMQPSDEKRFNAAAPSTGPADAFGAPQRMG